MPDLTQQRRRPIRVALSNDYEIALLGLAQMLARHPAEIQIVDITTLTAPAHEPDIILYDTFGRMPDDDVKLRRIVDENQAQVVVYSWDDDYPEDAARRHGAAAYVHKGLSSPDLVAALTAIHDGRTPPDTEPAGEPELTWPGQSLGLTRRESEILTFITRGLTNEDIVRRSFLSINTVKSYIRSAYRKIGVRTRAQAVGWGYRHGFESTDDTGV